jgi:hypothetical protein
MPEGSGEPGPTQVWAGRSVLTHEGDPLILVESRQLIIVVHGGEDGD